MPPKKNTLSSLENILTHDRREKHSNSIVKIIKPSVGSWWLDIDTYNRFIDIYYGLASTNLALPEYLVSMSEYKAGIYRDYDLHLKPELIDADLDEQIQKIISEDMTSFINQALSHSIKNVKFGKNKLTGIIFKKEHRMLKTVNLDSGETLDIARDGYHLYFGNLLLNKSAKTQIHNNLMQNISFEIKNIFNEISYPEHIPIANKQIDGGPLTSAATLPYSRKPDAETGYIIWKEFNVFIKYDIDKNDTTAFVDKITFTEPVNIKKETFRTCCLVGPSDDSNVITLKTDFDDAIEVIKDINTTENISSDLEERIEKEILGCPNLGKIYELLKLLKPEIYTRSHDERLHITNICATNLTYDQALIVLKWYYNLVQPEDNTKTYNSEQHIVDKINEALKSGKNLNISVLNNKITSEKNGCVNKSLVEEVYQKYSTFDPIESFYKACYVYEKSIPPSINKKAISNLIYDLIGHNWNTYTIMSGGKSDIRYYYYYEHNEERDNIEIEVAKKNNRYLVDTSEKRFGKWNPCTGTSALTHFHTDLEYYVCPYLKKQNVILVDAIKTASLSASSTLAILKIKQKLVVDALKTIDDDTTDRTINGFRIIVNKKSKTFNFQENLNKNGYITGFYNGSIFLHKDNKNIEKSYYEFIKGDENRKIYNSKTMGCAFNESLSLESECVKDVYNLIKTILSENEIVDYYLMCIGLSVFANAGGGMLLVKFGTGSDGKSTLNELVSKTLGNATLFDGEESGYALPFKPSVLQTSTKDSNGHDESKKGLYKCRYNSASDIDENNPYINEGRLKNLLSGELSEHRGSHEHNQYDTIKTLLDLSVNKIVKVANNNEGTIRRIRYIPCLTKFYDSGNENRYKNYENAIRADRSVLERVKSDESLCEGLAFLLLHYAMEGVKKYKGQIENITIPKVIDDFTKSILGQSDKFGIFAESSFEKSDNSEDHIPISDIIEKYAIWKDNFDGVKNSRADPFADILNSSYSGEIALKVREEQITDENGNVKIKTIFKNIGTTKMVGENKNNLYLVNYKYKVKNSDIFNEGE